MYEGKVEDEGKVAPVGIRDLSLGPVICTIRELQQMPGRSLPHLVVFRKRRNNTQL